MMENIYPTEKKPLQEVWRGFVVLLWVIVFSVIQIEGRKLCRKIKVVRHGTLTAKPVARRVDL